MGFNEDYERKLMNPKLKATLVKVGVGALFTIPLGALVKLNYLCDDKIDEKYNPSTDEEETTS